MVRYFYTRLSATEPRSRHNMRARIVIPATPTAKENSKKRAEANVDVKNGQTHISHLSESLASDIGSCLAKEHFHLQAVGIAFLAA